MLGPRYSQPLLCCRARSALYTYKEADANTGAVARKSRQRTSRALMLAQREHAPAPTHVGRMHSPSKWPTGLHPPLVRAVEPEPGHRLPERPPQAERRAHARQVRAHRLRERQGAQLLHAGSGPCAHSRDRSVGRASACGDHVGCWAWQDPSVAAGREHGSGREPQCFSRARAAAVWLHAAAW